MVNYKVIHKDAIKIDNSLLRNKYVMVGEVDRLPSILTSNKPIVNHDSRVFITIIGDEASMTREDLYKSFGVEPPKTIPMKVFEKADKYLMNLPYEVYEIQ